MEIKEFRIGNIFNSNGIRQVVAEDIYQWSIGKVFGEPVSICAKALIALGFTKQHNGDDFIKNDVYAHKELEFSFCIDGYFFNYTWYGYESPTIMGNVKYIHQLQNLCYFLMGIDLEYPC